MKILSAFKDLTKTELVLWITSVAMITGSSMLSSANNYFTWITCLIGVTALIFVAKGYVIGQILTVVFAVFYGVISYYFGYYGEMISYLGMTSPVAILAVLSWIRHPFEDTSEVAVNQMSKRQVAVMFALTAVVTCFFYFILKALGTTNLFFSTVSIATSFMASYLTFLRSSFYAVGYMTNDLILMILWGLATFENPEYLPMFICFLMFFVTDSYGFMNWKTMQKRQAALENS